MNKKLDFNHLSREALKEMIEAVEHCISYRKKDYEQWTDSTFPGCLGIPAAILLFSIADAIGSYHRDNSEFVVSVDGKNQTIKKNKHFDILNSKFYGFQELSRIELNALYENYRCILTHNLGLPGSSILILDSRGSKLIEKKRIEQNDHGWVLNLNVFFNLTKKAVDMFLPESEKIIKNSSFVKTGIEQKDLSVFGEIDLIDQVYNSNPSGDYISPSGTNYTIPPNNSNH